MSEKKFESGYYNFEDWGFDSEMTNAIELAVRQHIARMFESMTFELLPHGDSITIYLNDGENSQAEPIARQTISFEEVVSNEYGYEREKMAGALEELAKRLRAGEFDA